MRIFRSCSSPSWSAAPPAFISGDQEVKLTINQLPAAAKATLPNEAGGATPSRFLNEVKDRKLIGLELAP